MTDTLVDTSAWVDFLRGDGAAKRRVDPLLEDGQAAICGPVYAEVLSGARDRVVYGRLTLLFGALRWVDADEAAWRRVAELRFLLARQGVQAHLVDLLIAATAEHRQVALLTRDRDFQHIARLAAIDITIF